MFRRRHHHPEHSEPRPCDGEFRLDHFVNVKTGGIISLINTRDGVIGVVEGQNLDDSRRLAEIIMDEWDIEKVARAGND